MATFEQLAYFRYVKELMDLEAAERLDELCKRLEGAELTIAAMGQHIATLEARTSEPPRRGPGRPRTRLNG